MEPRPISGEERHGHWPLSQTRNFAVCWPSRLCSKHSITTEMCCEIFGIFFDSQKLTGRKIKPQAGADSWIRCRIFLHSKSAGKVWISKSYTQNQHWNETLFCIIIITREWRCRLQFFYLFNPLLILFSLIAFRLWFLTCFCLRRRVNCIFSATLFMQSS